MTGESGSPSPAISKSKSCDAPTQPAHSDLGRSSGICISDDQVSSEPVKECLDQVSAGAATIVASAESSVPDLILDEAAIELALKDTSESAVEKSGSIDGDDDVADGDDWAEEEKKLREENR